MASSKKARAHKAGLVIVGTAMLITGITLILVWWPQVVSLFKGFIPMALAIGGLLVLYFIKE